MPLLFWGFLGVFIADRMAVLIHLSIHVQPAIEKFLLHLKGADYSISVKVLSYTLYHAFVSPDNDQSEGGDTLPLLLHILVLGSKGCFHFNR